MSQQCQVGPPSYHIDKDGHRWKRNLKLKGDKLTWDDGEWFCEYCHEKTTSDLEQWWLEESRKRAKERSELVKQAIYTL